MGMSRVATTDTEFLEAAIHSAPGPLHIVVESDREANQTITHSHPLSLLWRDFG